MLGYFINVFDRVGCSNKLDMTLYLFTLAGFDVCNRSTQNTEAGGLLWLWGQSGVHSELQATLNKSEALSQEIKHTKLKAFSSWTEQMEMCLNDSALPFP